MKRLFSIFALLLCCTAISATEWHNPQNRDVSPMQGLHWQGEERESYLDKLPARVKKSLPKRVCTAVNNTNGVSVRFRTSSPNIAVRYTTTTLPNIPTVQLFGTDNHGGVRTFEVVSSFDGDVVTHSFEDIEFSNAVHKGRGYDYQLWLPAEGQIANFEIGVDDEAFFDFKDCREELPIVLYDCEGEGVKWSVNLGVEMDRPIISLNGDVMELMAEIEAKAFIINSSTKKSSKVEEAVKAVRVEHPETPILVSQKKIYEKLLADGYEEVYLAEDQGDLVASYVQKLREVLSCPIGAISTTRPVVQSRSGAIEWHDQCGYILKELREGGAKSAVLGNSIVQNWSSNTPYEKRYGGGKAGRAGLECWDKYMDGFINMGIGSDRVENLLWRVYNDQFEIVDFEQIIIMIGTNNLRLSNTYDEIAEGIENLIEQIQVRQPEAYITVVAVLPRKDIPWDQLQTLNAKIKSVARRRGVEYRNVGKVLLDENDVPRDEFYSDGVHLSVEGYMVYGEALMAY